MERLDFVRGNSDRNPLGFRWHMDPSPRPTSREILSDNRMATALYKRTVQPVLSDNADASTESSSYTFLKSVKLADFYRLPIPDETMGGGFPELAEFSPGRAFLRLALVIQCVHSGQPCRLRTRAPGTRRS